MGTAAALEAGEERGRRYDAGGRGAVTRAVAARASKASFLLIARSHSRASPEGRAARVYGVSAA